MKIALRAGTLSATAVALLMAFAGPAVGHAAYSDSNPPDEGTVSSPPSEIWAEFTEPPADGSYLQVFDECGAKVDNGDSRVQAFRIYVTMSSPSSGTYRVRFRVLSAYDNHVTQGEFTFDSTGGESCAGTEEEPDPEAGGNDGSSGGDGGGGPGGDGSGDGAAGGTDTGRGSGGGSGGGGHQGHGSGDPGNHDSGPEEDPGDDDGLDLARDRRPAEKGLMEGIDWGEFAFALALAALIGGAGGKVYAGIVGPRR